MTKTSVLHSSCVKCNMLKRQLITDQQVKRNAKNSIHFFYLFQWDGVGSNDDDVESVWLGDKSNPLKGTTRRQLP